MDDERIKAHLDLMDRKFRVLAEELRSQVRYNHEEIQKLKKDLLTAGVLVGFIK